MASEEHGPPSTELLVGPFALFLHEKLIDPDRPKLPRRYQTVPQLLPEHLVQFRNQLSKIPS